MYNIILRINQLNRIVSAIADRSLDAVPVDSDGLLGAYIEFVHVQGACFVEPHVDLIVCTD